MERRFGGGRRSREDRDGGCGGYTHEGQGERTRCGVEGATATNTNTSNEHRGRRERERELAESAGDLLPVGQGLGQGLVFLFRRRAKGEKRAREVVTVAVKGRETTRH